MDLRRILYSNIVLSGGSTLFKGDGSVFYCCDYLVVVLLVLSNTILFFLQDLEIGY